jgi:Domain of unknown function (DUF222)
VEYASTSPENQDLAKALDDEICEFSGVAHAALARVAKASAGFDSIGGWGAGGIRSFPHWLTVKTGFDMHTGAELLRVGQAVRLLPKIAQAFEAGQLSFDKARQITTVATPATEEFLLEIARGASGAQLARICRSLRRIAEADAPGQADDHLSRRGIWMHWDEHGMLELVARLTPEDAAVVQAALESITGSRPVPEPADDGVKDPADDRWAARKVDALVAMCEQVMAGGAENLFLVDGSSPGRGARRRWRADRRGERGAVLRRRRFTTFGSCGATDRVRCRGGWSGRAEWVAH